MIEQDKELYETEHYSVPIYINEGCSKDDIFFTANEGGYFGIAFDKIFNREDMKIYNLFELLSKRNFKNLSEDVLQTYRELFLENGEIKKSITPLFYNILKAKSEIDASDPDAEIPNPMQFNSFMDIVKRICAAYNGLLLKTIDEYVETNYKLNLNEHTERMISNKKKVNTEIMITDDIGRDITKSAYLFRFFVPLIAVYYFHNKSIFSKIINITVSEEELEDDDETMTFNIASSQVFESLMELICGADKAIAIKRKFYKMVTARLAATGFRDRGFWEVARNLSITLETENVGIYRKVINSAIPKINCDAGNNLVSFISAVINNQVDFVFLNKFKYKVSVLPHSTSMTEEDEDDVTVNSVFDKYDYFDVRRDEGAYILRKLNFNDILDKIANEFNVGLTNIESQKFSTLVKSNPIQETIVSMLVLKYFKDHKILKSLTAIQYTKLVLVCEKYLRQNGYDNLAIILRSKCTRHKERSNLCGKKMRPAILDSKLYRNLFQTKYKSFFSSVDDPMIALIGTVYGSEFTDENGEISIKPDVKIHNIAKEIVLLLKEV